MNFKGVCFIGIWALIFIITGLSVRHLNVKSHDINQEFKQVIVPRTSTANLWDDDEEYVITGKDEL